MIAFLLLGVVVPIALSADGPSATYNLTGPSGNISSQNWPHHDYLINTAQRWVITTPMRTVASVSFLSPFNLEGSSSGFCYDSVTVYDGMYLSQLGDRCSGSSVPSLGKFCGTTVPPMKTASGNMIIVEFCSDDSGNKKGFGAIWSSYVPTTTTSTTTTPYTGPSTTAPPFSCGLSSPKYPEDVTYNPDGTVNGFTTTKIVGGHHAPVHSWPWAAALFTTDDGQEWYQFCGGSLIANQWVATAGHCFFGNTDDLSVYKVKLGADNKGTGWQANEPTQKVCGITKAIVNPQYTSAETSGWDITLLKLDCVVTYNDYIKPICLSYPGEPVGTGENTVVIGWGTTSSFGSDSPTLMEVIVPIVSNQECNTDYQSGGYTITDTMLCAGLKQGGKDSCQGDSGGALMAHHNGTWRLTGIVSWGQGCAEPGYPGVYGRADRFTSWAMQTMVAN